MNKIYFFLITLILTACGGGRPDTDEPLQAPPELSDLLEDVRVDNPWDSNAGPMPDDDCVKMKINFLGGTLGRIFNDSNHLHLQAAEAIGIHPVENDYRAWHLRRPILEVKSNKYLMVDRLTHSYPYLVPEAADLLNEIGARFAAEQKARGGGDYRLKVTSLMRTSTTVAKLRRRNRNATEASAHQYGTTFDISYAKFVYDGTGVHRTQEDLKNLLGEVLFKLRDEGRCYVKYEKKQGCFHITVRPDPQKPPQNPSQNP